MFYYIRLQEATSCISEIINLKKIPPSPSSPVFQMVDDTEGNKTIIYPFNLPIELVITRFSFIYNHFVTEGVNQNRRP